MHEIILSTDSQHCANGVQHRHNSSRRRAGWPERKLVTEVERRTRLE